MLIAAWLGMPGGILLFIPIYHPLHDIYNIHTEITVFMLFAIFFVFILRGLLSERQTNNTRLTTIDYILLLQLAVHYLIYWVFVVFFNPEREWSLGFHEPVGPCQNVSRIVTPIGQTLYKRTFLCFV